MMQARDDGLPFGAVEKVPSDDIAEMRGRERVWLVLNSWNSWNSWTEILVYECVNFGQIDERTLDRCMRLS